MSDYQPSDCPSEAASSGLQGYGGVSSRLVDQFARASGEVKTLACSGHPLQHGHTFLPTYFQLKLTIPSAKTSHLFDSAIRGIAAENKVISSSAQLILHAYSLWSIFSWLINCKCSFYPVNPNPNFSYKIGNFACPTISVYLHRIRKDRDLGYYSESKLPRKIS